MSQPVVDFLDVDTFFDDFLTPGRPVLIHGAVTGGGEPLPWRLEWLTGRFGSYRVPLYGTLFDLNGVSTLDRYVSRFTGPAAAATAPQYLRWFVRQSTAELPWSDRVFEELEADWQAPRWAPDRDFAFPRVSRADPARDPFPGKGLLICGRGGRTRLHTDPWVTDAFLLQTTGIKQVTLFAPEDRHLLTDADGVVDLDQPDDARFPHWQSAVPVLEALLRPGDLLFIPAGWFHSVVAVTDSVSITWNFVHRIHERRFARYLDEGGATDPTVEYFLSRSS